MLVGGSLIGSGGFSPKNLSPKLWLDGADAATFSYSSGSLVSQWNDKSGNGYNATQGTVANQPTRTTNVQNGNAAISFDGALAYMLSNITGLHTATALQVFMVLAPTNASSADATNQVRWSFGDFGTAVKGLQQGLGTSNLTGEKITVAFDNAVDTGGRLGSSTASWSAGEWQVITTSVGSSGSSMTKDGSAVTLDLAFQITTSTDCSPNQTGYSTDDNFCIATAFFNATFVARYGGYIGEILVFFTPVTGQNLANLKTYLGNKWAITMS